MKTKIYIIITCLTFMAALTIASIIMIVRQNAIPLEVDKYIMTSRVGDRVLVVNLGYDAVVAIASSKGLVVVDAGISNSLTSKYRNIIETAFRRNDFAYLINTHSHHDHTGGNQVFPGAAIIGHQNVPDEMIKYGKDREKIKSILSGIIKNRATSLKGLKPGSREWTEIFCKKACSEFALADLHKNRVVTPPCLTFADSLVLPLDDMTLHLRYFGPAHSRSDILIHIPELKLLLTGDLFSKKGYPSLEKELLKDDPASRIKSVQWIKSRWEDIETVIGGHGQIMDRTDLGIFLDQLNYISTGP
jgi:glyoxylase-like metal-dependent hydrolase (beta-lactamase superfamily II)